MEGKWMKDQNHCCQGRAQSKDCLLLSIGETLLNGGNPRDVVMFPTQFCQSAASASLLTAFVPCSLPRSK